MECINLIANNAYVINVYNAASLSLQISASSNIT